MATEKHAQLALRQAEAKLSKHSNVVGLGIVSATDDIAGKDVALGVYVKKLEKAKGRGAGGLPQSVAVKVGTRTVEVPVKIIEQGEVRPEGSEKL
jgi:hypothetical protein